MSRAFITGAAFGGALTATGIYQPDVIISQLEMENWHMIQTFLTASGASMMIVTLARHLGYLGNLKPRSYSTLGLLATPLDGNLLGGYLQGVGMALAGACPGTVFAQIGGGVRSGLYTLGGALLGGALWSGVLRDAIRRRRRSRETKQRNDNNSNNSKSHGDNDTNDVLSVHELLGAKSPLPALALVESFFAAVVATVSLLGLSKTPAGISLVGPVTGGLLIAGAQLVSIVARGSLLGTSTSFEEAGDYVVWWISGAEKGGKRTKPTSRSAMVLVSGMVAGALAVSQLASLPSSPNNNSAGFPQTTTTSVGAARSVLGGVLLAVGSRMAGGCTSGHGISGISLFSVSSFVTIAAMFAGGMATAILLK
ncbi:hypothetical protein F5X99DRAFT_420292 [Biscogniauxia marginata]|nr:hypothetical protein F5X99DRAFT_420292 [Biscogniauxia marginata]